MKRIVALGIAAALAAALVPQGSQNAEAAKIKAKKEPKKMFNAFANFGDIKGESQGKRGPRVKRR
jgi:hypothetical protein